MAIESIAIKAAVSIITKIGSWGVKKIFKSDFTPYEAELSKVIHESIDEYSKQYPITETDKIPFYTSEILVDEFFKFRFTAVLDEDKIITVLQSDNRILPPSKEQLMDFFKIFDDKISISGKLKELNIESNYKEEIFNLSNNLKQSTDQILSSINQLKSEIGSLTNNPSLTEEWSRQLDEILDNLKTYKPYTAQERLKSLELRIRNSGLQANKQIFARLYYMQALCLDQMEGADITNEGAKLFIKAYKQNANNEEYKANAALSHYVLGNLTEATDMGQELLSEDEFSVTGWLIECFVKGSDFIDLIPEIPVQVRNSQTFRIHLYQWVTHHQYVKRVEEFDRLGLAFIINLETPPKINYSNRHYNLSKAFYLLNKYYQQQKSLSISLHFPTAKDDAGFVYANKILHEILQQVKGSEIEDKHHIYAFHYYASTLILTEEIDMVFEMEKKYNQLESPPYLVTLTMSKAYLNLHTKEATAKAIDLLEALDVKTDIGLPLMKGIIYSFMNKNEKVEENYLTYLDSHSVFTTNAILNSSSFIRQGRLVLSQTLKDKFEKILSHGLFENDALKVIFQIVLYLGYNIGFASNEDFYTHLKKAETSVNPNDAELSIYIAYGLAHIEKWEEAITYLKDKINYDEPSEAYKLYCRILYKAPGHKPELIEHLKKWRDRFYIETELIGMELYFAQLQKSWREVVRIAKVAVAAYPQSDLFLHYLFLGLSEAIDIEGIKSHAILVKNREFELEDYGIGIAMALQKGGMNEMALELLYRQASKKSNTKTRLAYITLSIHFPPELLIDYDTVSAGTYVKYMVGKKKEIILITEENKDDFPQTVLVGKKVGEAFTFQRPMQSLLETGNIMRVCDKYLALLEEILIQAENPLSGLGIQMMEFEDDSVESLKKTLISNYGIEGTLEKERIEKEFENYYAGQISFTDIVNSVFKRNFIDAYYVLSDKNGKLFRGISSALATQAELTDHTRFILDFTSVCLLHDLTKESGLRFAHKFIVSSLLKDEVIKRLEEEKDSPRKELSVSVTQNDIQPHFYPENFKEIRILRFESLLKWIESNCEVAPVPERLNFIMGLDENAKRDNFFQLLVENKLLTERPEHILLTNDTFYYRTFHCSTTVVVSVQAYLDKIHSQKGKEITGFLLSHNYIGIRLTAETLNEELFRMLSGNQNKFAICLENLRFGWNPHRGHIGEVIMFIKSIYISSFVNPVTRQQIITTVFSNLLVGLNVRMGNMVSNLLAREFKFLPMQLMEVLQIFTNVLQMQFPR